MRQEAGRLPGNIAEDVVASGTQVLPCALLWTHIRGISNAAARSHEYQHARNDRTVHLNPDAVAALAKCPMSNRHES